MEILHQLGGFEQAIFDGNIEIVGLLRVRKVNKDDKHSPSLINYIASFPVVCSFLLNIPFLLLLSLCWKPKHFM